MYDPYEYVVLIKYPNKYAIDLYSEYDFRKEEVPFLCNRLNLPVKNNFREVYEHITELKMT